MKTRQSDDWNNPWTNEERLQIDQLLVAVTTDLKPLCIESAETLRVMQTDFTTQLATMIVVAKIPRNDSVRQQFAQCETIVTEAERLLSEEEKWISFLKLETDQGQEKAKSHHMVLLTMINDMRVILVLLARQLVRMRYLKNHSAAEQQQVSLETRHIYVPLANRLGIGHIKWEMEDAAFRFLNQDSYKQIAKALEERRADREQFIENIIAELKTLLSENGIEASVFGRPKHIFSIWRKMDKKHLSFSQLYDVRAVRVIVQNVADCYSVLSLVHGKWRFIPKEYDDYIAAPKPNRYQSLHTAVYGPDEKVVEIQIRTWDMHQNAELGVAAHWRYKEGSQNDAGLDQQIESWRRLLSEDQIDTAAHNEPIADSIYALTPQGHVVELKNGATPLDFAYQLHTNLGHRCRGAKVNGQMVPLTTTLKSGQQVEVITVKEGGPSRDWMNPNSGYVKTSRALAKVKQWFKQQFKIEDIERGRQLLTKELSANALASTDWLVVAKRFNLKTSDDFFAAVGRTEIGVKQVANYLRDEKEKSTEVDAPAVEVKHAPTKHHDRSAIVVEGVGDLLTHFARCCKPVPGDRIVGFITKGRGVSIHREICPNAKRLLRDSGERFIQVEWGSHRLERFDVDVLVEAIDRPGLLRDVTSILTAEEVNVLAANTYTNKKTGEASLKLTLELHNMEQLQHALARINQLKNVLTAIRQ